tara:strand:+ start:810 stop:1190 length:381 start_codon:yes stop_codon:yes gene_type:complete
MLELVTPQVRGIIWLTDKPIQQLPKHFAELDYLFDGIISKKIASDESEAGVYEKNFFSGKSFDKDLVLIQIWGSDTNKITKELLDAVSLVPAREDGTKILVLGEKASQFPEKSFKSKFKTKYQILT